MKLSLLSACAICLLLTMLGCSDRVRVDDQQLSGTYAMEFQDVRGNYQVKEQFTLNPDHTYVQAFSSYPRQFTNRGAWKSSGQFLGGTEVELSRVDRSEYDPPGVPPSYSTLNLEVQRQKGRLRLAIYEKADWTYYDRVQ
jgi:hypothetical protein